MEWKGGLEVVESGPFAYNHFLTNDSSIDTHCARECECTSITVECFEGELIPKIEIN